VRTVQSSYNLEKLSALVEINIGKTPSRNKSTYWSGDNTWVAISDLKGDKYIESTKEGITDKGILESGIKIVPSNTILFSFKLSIGKVAITQKPLFTNEAIASFPVKDTLIVDQNYLYYVLREFNFTDGGDRAVMGKTLNKAKLKELKVPLPPLPEQKQIAAILDTADQLRQKDQQLIEKYNTLSQSLFLDMFGDPVVNPMGWEQTTLDKVCDKIYGGGTPSKSIPEYYYGNIPWVTPKDMKSEYIKGSIDHINNEAIDNSSAKLIEPQAVLMVIRSGILKHTLPVAINICNVTVNQDMKAFIPNKTLTNSCYLLHYFKGVENYLLSKVRAVTADNIEFKQIKELSFPIPPLTLQNQFAERIQAIEAQKQQAQASLQKSEDLFNSLLQRAFKGELTA